MIQQKKKICKDCNKEVYLFSHGRCKTCAALFKLSNQTESEKPIKLPSELLEKVVKIKRNSNTNTYQDSDGNRWTSKQIEDKVNKAKEEKIKAFLEEHGYIFCEDCNVSNAFKFDCSHEISVKEAKEIGQVELCWDVCNIKLRCRDCHSVHDGLN
jgi:hypothetical protein